MLSIMTLDVVIVLLFEWKCCQFDSFVKWKLWILPLIQYSVPPAAKKQSSRQPIYFNSLYFSMSRKVVVAVFLLVLGPLFFMLTSVDCRNVCAFPHGPSWGPFCMFVGMCAIVELKWWKAMVIIIIYFIPDHISLHGSTETVPFVADKRRPFTKY